MTQIDYIRRLKIFIAFAFEFKVPLSLVTDLIKYIRFCTDRHPDFAMKFQKMESVLINSVDMLLDQNPEIPRIFEKMNNSEEMRRLKLLFIINWKFGRCQPTFTDLILKTSSLVGKEDPNIGKAILELEQLFVHSYEFHTFGLPVLKSDENGMPEIRKDLGPFDRRLREYYNAHCKLRN